MDVQAGISRERLKRKVGTVQRVLIDEVGPKGAIGRTSSDAPEIDGVVHVRASKRLKAGEFSDVLIESSDDHDLAGRLAPARR
jgi:ribosomal protein S12 methylthiotransferase